MKKSATIIILISLVMLLVICVVGNIITVADKVSQLSPWLGYAFYPKGDPQKGDDSYAGSCCNGHKERHPGDQEYILISSGITGY